MPSVLLRVQRPERLRGNRSEIVVRQVVRHWNTQSDETAQLNALRHRELFDLVNDMSDGLSHAVRICTGRIRASVEAGLTRNQKKLTDDGRGTRRLQP